MNSWAHSAKLMVEKEPNAEGKRAAYVQFANKEGDLVMNVQIPLLNDIWGGVGTWLLSLSKEDENEKG